MIQCFEQLLDRRVLHQCWISAYLGHTLIRLLLCPSQEQAEDRSLSNQS